MHKITKLLSGLTALSLLLTFSVSIALAAPAAKVNVCHRTGKGTFIKINISENAFQTHIEHGDGLPGDLVPGVPGKKFKDDCTLADANANVAGSWRGQSGLTGTMGYWFDMSLYQDTAGNVTGTVNYDIGIVRTVSGVVSGNSFTFITSDGSYWADCDPCTVSVSGDYFHGYGTSSTNQNIEWEATKP